MQECALVWVKCYNRYIRTATVDNAAWFMGKYLMALENRWHTLALKDMKRRSIEGVYSEEAADGMTRAPSSDGNLGPLLARWRGACAEFRTGASTFLACPAELAALILTAPDEAARQRMVRRLFHVAEPLNVAAYLAAARLSHEVSPRAATEAWSFWVDLLGEGA